MYKVRVKVCTKMRVKVRTQCEQKYIQIASKCMYSVRVKVLTKYK